MTTDWYRMLLDENGQRDLLRARTLNVNALREWLKDHFNGDDPSAPPGPDTDPVSLFKNVWEMIPGDEFKQRLSEAILMEYQACAEAPAGRNDYWAFILRLMTYLPVRDFPARDIWRRYRAPRYSKLRTAADLPLESFLIQALFARGAVSLSEQEALLKKRETANLAFKAIRDTGLGPASAHLPDLLTTLSEPTDDIAIITHLKILQGKYGERALVEELAASTELSQPVHFERLQRLLGKLGMHLPVRNETSRAASCVSIGPEEVQRKIAAVFRQAGDPLLGNNSRVIRSVSVWN